TYRGQIVEASGSAGVLFGVTGNAVIERPFRGVVAAPWGTVTLATVPAPGHLGAWFGHEIIARPDSVLTHRPFTAQDFCPFDAECSELCPCPPGGFSCERTEQCADGLTCSVDGLCACASNCAGKTCGSGPEDGCGSICPGICKVTDIGCSV